MVTLREKKVVATAVGGRPLISWGAIFAGLAFIVSGTWLMLLLGSAIGASVADATDAAAIGEGLGLGATIWMLLTALVVFFLGALLSARLSGNADDQAGMLHGVTLWSLATALLLVLSAWGVHGLMQTAGSIAGGVVAAGRTIGSTAVDGLQATGTLAERALESEVGDEIQARLKREASRVLAARQNPRGEQASAEEIRQAMDQIDADTLQAVTAALVEGDTEGAREALAEGTELTQAQVEGIVSGVSSSAKKALKSSDVARTVEKHVRSAVSEALGSLSDVAGPEVNRDELRRALQELDGTTLAAASRHLITGRHDRVKNVLIANTSLSEEEVHAVVDGVSAEVAQRVNEVKAEVEDTLETASDYSQAVLWASFVSAALALGVAVLGGMVGAGSVRRLVAIATTHDVVT